MPQSFNVSTASVVRHQHHQTDRCFLHGWTQYFSTLPLKRTMRIVKVQIHREAQRSSSLHAVHSPLNQSFTVRREQPLVVTDPHVIGIVAVAGQDLAELAEVKASGEFLHHCFDENQLLKMFTCGLLIACHLNLFAPHLGTNDGPINPDHLETWFLHAPENTVWPSHLSLTGDSAHWPSERHG